MPLAPGQILNNRYRIVKLLAQGGFGAVYRAWDLNMECPRALKENLDTSAEAQRQFKREARILGELIHPNLPRVIDHFIIPGQGGGTSSAYLVMDFVEGQDLQEMLDQSGSRLAEAQVLPWIGQVCEVLEYLHSQNPPIIHRDIKPANIKIRPDGRAMLVDFGIAKVYDPHLRTTAGARAVTPGYSPHEQYGQGTTDARTDVYALGATLCALLTGQPPAESIQRVIQDVLVPAERLNPAISPATAAALGRALCMDPAQRFQSAAEFRRALNPSPTPTPSLPLQGGGGKSGTVVAPALMVPPRVVAATIVAPAPAIPVVQKGQRMSLILAKGVEIEFICVLAGEFWMGSDKKQDPDAQDHELPQHEVYLDEYWIGRYPVTNLQYQAFVQARGHAAPPEWHSKKIPQGKEQHPVVNVSWQDAAAFCQWASQATGHNIRLPSEAEWEKAARGVDRRLYPWGNQPPTKQLGHFGKFFGGTKPVGQFSPQGDSPYGCADMAGNVWEWVADWFAASYYHTSPARNPTGPDTGGLRVLRGGSWDADEYNLRAAHRYKVGPRYAFYNFGFRYARSR